MHYNLQRKEQRYLYERRHETQGNSWSKTVARNRKGERGEEVKCMRSASFVATKTLALCRPVYRSMVRVFNFSSCCHWTVSILIIFSARIHPQQIKNRSSSFRIATYPILFTFCFGFFNALEKKWTASECWHTHVPVCLCAVGIQSSWNRRPAAPNQKLKNPVHHPSLQWMDIIFHAVKFNREVKHFPVAVGSTSISL